MAPFLSDQARAFFALSKQILIRMRKQHALLNLCRFSPTRSVKVAGLSLRMRLRQMLYLYNNMKKLEEKTKIFNLFSLSSSLHFPILPLPLHFLLSFVLFSIFTSLVTGFSLPLCVRLVLANSSYKMHLQMKQNVVHRRWCVRGILRSAVADADRGLT
jgi:hypothetical protein